MAFTSQLETDVFGKSTVTITQRPRSSSAESISVPGGEERRGRKEAINGSVDGEAISGAR
jgi:hypothetical protein